MSTKPISRTDSVPTVNPTREEAPVEETEAPPSIEEELRNGTLLDDPEPREISRRRDLVDKAAKEMLSLSDGTRAIARQVSARRKPNHPTPLWGKTWRLVEKHLGFALKGLAVNQMRSRKAELRTRIDEYRARTEQRQPNHFYHWSRVIADAESELANLVSDPKEKKELLLAAMSDYMMGLHYFPEERQSYDRSTYEAMVNGEVKKISERLNELERQHPQRATPPLEVASRASRAARHF